MSVVALVTSVTSLTCFVRLLPPSGNAVVSVPSQCWLAAGHCRVSSGCHDCRFRADYALTFSRPMESEVLLGKSEKCLGQIKFPLWAAPVFDTGDRQLIESSDNHLHWMQVSLVDWYENTIHCYGPNLRPGYHEQGSYPKLGLSQANILIIQGISDSKLPGVWTYWKGVAWGATPPEQVSSPNPLHPSSWHWYSQLSYSGEGGVDRRSWLRLCPTHTSNLEQVESKAGSYCAPTGDPKLLWECLKPCERHRTHRRAWNIPRGRVFLSCNVTARSSYPIGGW